MVRIVFEKNIHKRVIPSDVVEGSCDYDLSNGGETRGKESLKEF